MTEHVLCDQCKHQEVINLDRIDDFKKTEEFKKLEAAYKKHPEYKILFQISKRANTYQVTIRVYFNRESFIVYFIPFDKVQKFLIGFIKALGYTSYFQIMKEGQTLWSIEKYPFIECPDDSRYYDFDRPFLCYKEKVEDGKELLFYFPIYQVINDKLFKLEIAGCVDGLKNALEKKSDWLANKNLMTILMETTDCPFMKMMSYYVYCDTRPDTKFQIWTNAGKVAGAFFILIVGGLASQETPWSSFLTRGLYDPRLLVFIFAFTSNKTKCYCPCHSMECYCNCYDNSDGDFFTDDECDCICHDRNCCECSKI